jgi:hypothetical protein
VKCAVLHSLFAIKPVHASDSSRADIIVLFVQDSTEKHAMFNAIDNFPCIRRKAEWAQKVCTPSFLRLLDRASRADFVPWCSVFAVDQKQHVVRRAPRGFRGRGGQMRLSHRSVCIVRTVAVDCMFAWTSCCSGHLLLRFVLCHFLVLSFRAYTRLRSSSVLIAHVTGRVCIAAWKCGGGCLLAKGHCHV